MTKFKVGDLVKPTEQAKQELDGHIKWAEHVYPWKITQAVADRVQVEMYFKTKKKRRSVWHEMWLELVQSTAKEQEAKE